MAEASECIFCCEAEAVEHLLLNFWIVDSDRTAAHFVAVTYDIVCLSHHLFRSCFEEWDIFVTWRCEWVVLCIESFVAVIIFTLFEEWEVCYPEELEVVCADEVLAASNFATECAESCLCCFCIFVSDDSKKVAFLDIHTFVDCCHNVSRHILCEGGRYAVLCNLSPCKALSAVCLDVFAEGIDFLTAHLAANFVEVDSVNGAAVFDSGNEWCEATVLNEVRDITELEAEAHIRLIGAETAHCFCVCEAENWCFNVNATEFLENLLDEAFLDSHDVFHIYEGHFKVNLCEFWLTVSTEVFVTEAACNLHIAVNTGEHKHLLVLLWGLWESVECAWMYTGRNEVVSCAFWCGLCEHWCFDFPEALLCKVVTCYLSCLMADFHNSLERWAAKVEITILETEHFVCIDVIVYFEWRCFSLCENCEVFSKDFNLTCWDVRVDGRTHTDCTFDSYNPFHTHFFSAESESSVNSFVEYALYDTCAVAQVCEDKAAEVTVTTYPAINGDFFTDILLAECAAVAAVCAVIHINTPL